MRRALLCIACILVLVSAGLFAQTQTSVVRLSSIVKNQTSGNPSVIIGINSTTLDFDTLMDPNIEATAITGLDLTEDGVFTFALMTSENVYMSSGSSSYIMSIEVSADGFHRYEYKDSQHQAGYSMEGSDIVEYEAVPIKSLTPNIQIPRFQGENENVSVVKTSDRGNVVNVQFNPGHTRSQLILGTFSVEWEGRKPLEAGIYKAEVYITYSTP